MDSTGLVSIIVPVYNVRAYLREALDSVVGQTYGNLEIIVVDDGSTDGSGEICDEYAARDERVSVIHQANKGLSGARNAGLDRMHGEAVAFLDSDDAYHRDFVKLMMTAMEREQADIVVCRYIHVRKMDEAEKPVSQSRKAPSIRQGMYDRKEALCALVEDRINVSMWNKLYRSSLWDGLRFPEGRVYEDVYTSYKVFDRSEATYVADRTLHFYRKRDDRITSTMTWENERDRIEAGAEFESYVKANIPGIFSEKQLTCWRQLEMHVLLQRYICVMRSRRSDRKTTGNRVRKEIIKRGEEWGVAGYRRTLRIAYKLLRRCPKLLLPGYSLYRVVGRIKRGVKEIICFE